MINLRSIDTSFIDSRGHSVGKLRIADRSADSIHVVEATTAAEHNEEPLQLLEGRTYDYEVSGLPDGVVVASSAMVQPNALAKASGRIETGTWTGLLTVELENAREVVASARFEVRSAKLTYRAEYRAMLDDVADATAALLLEVKSPAAARLAPDPEHDAATLHQRLALLRWLLSGTEFEQAMDQIAAQPHHSRLDEPVERDPRSGMRPSPQVIREIASAARRFPVPKESPLHARLCALGFKEPSLPTRVTQKRNIDSVDTAENRFVKHALSEFQHYLRTSIRALRQGESEARGRRMLREAEALDQRVSRWLATTLMQSVGRPMTLPLGSPVLQRRAGYRELLRIWLTFQLATRLTWKGADDVLLAGRRDVATLYEYWVFFKLLDLGRGLFSLTARASDLIEPTADGFDLKLRSGKHICLDGIYTGGSRVLTVEFNYNRTFTRSGIYPSAGSWTKPMRPDFTFSFWPAEFDRKSAEEQELIVHVHFDAKYRVDNLVSLFGRDDEDEAGADKEDLKRGVPPKRADLLKMHAYRDAIRRTEGAYVLYPGVRSAERQDWLEFHEVIPGLGAFALRPQAAVDSLLIIRRFLEQVADHCCDLTTRSEQQGYHTFRIQEPSGRYRSTLQLPTNDERHGKLRPRPTVEPKL